VRKAVTKAEERKENTMSYFGKETALVAKTEIGNRLCL